MTHTQAIDLMKTSKSIIEWNSNREKVKKAFPFKSKEELFATPLPEIDGSGLVSKTLNQ